MVTEEKAATVLPRIRTATVLEEAVRDADAVFESVFEDVALKTEIFRQLDALSPPPCDPGQQYLIPTLKRVHGGDWPP